MLSHARITSAMIDGTEFVIGNTSKAKVCVYHSMMTSRHAGPLCPLKSMARADPYGC